jgi:ABC-type hemin transport system substrate-binding protein
VSPQSASQRRPPVHRIVSLVPSLTESLFDLGLGDRVAAVTDFCVHPAGAAKLPHVGGTKNPRCEEIIALKPDLVLANQEENRPDDVARLREAGLEVWVTFPRTVREALDVLWELLRRLDRPDAGPALMTIEHILDWTRAAAASQMPTTVFCPVWRGQAAAGDWWMTVNAETYLHDLLQVCGGRNIFAGRQRRYPLAADLLGEDGDGTNHAAERDMRYPRVTSAEVIAAQPEVVLLPSEPYAFTEADRDDLLALPDLPAARSGRVHLVDGSLLTWHGTRLARALQEIPPLLAAQ